MQTLSARGTGIGKCLLRDIGRRVRAVCKKRVLDIREKTLVNGAKPATRNDLLGANARHAPSHAREHAHFLIGARGKITQPGFTSRDSIALTAPEQDRFTESSAGCDIKFWSSPLRR